MPLKFIHGDNGLITDAIKAIEYAQRNKISILNCSWGWYGDRFKNIFEDIIRESDILFVFAAGNKKPDEPKTNFYPACVESSNLVSVSAIDGTGKLDPNSNYGDKILVAAPGVGILTTSPENKYRLFQGSSIAAPFVTGVAALIKSYKPSLTSNEIKIILERNVTKFDELNGVVKTGGIVNAYKSLIFLSPD
jgi:subtilisin family serine protease